MAVDKCNFTDVQTMFVCIGSCVSTSDIFKIATFTTSERQLCITLNANPSYPYRSIADITMDTCGKTIGVVSQKLKYRKLNFAKAEVQLEFVDTETNQPMGICLYVRDLLEKQSLAADYSCNLWTNVHFLQEGLLVDSDDVRVYSRMVADTIFNQTGVEQSWPHTVGYSVNGSGIVEVTRTGGYPITQGRSHFNPVINIGRDAVPLDAENKFRSPKSIYGETDFTFSWHRTRPSLNISVVPARGIIHGRNWHMVANNETLQAVKTPLAQWGEVMQVPMDSMLVISKGEIVREFVSESIQDCKRRCELTELCSGISYTESQQLCQHTNDRTGTTSFQAEFSTKVKRTAALRDIAQDADIWNRIVPGSLNAFTDRRDLFTQSLIVRPRIPKPARDSDGRDVYELCLPADWQTYPDTATDQVAFLVVQNTLVSMNPSRTYRLRIIDAAQGDSQQDACAAVSDIIEYPLFLNRVVRIPARCLPKLSLNKSYQAVAIETPEPATKHLLFGFYFKVCYDPASMGFVDKESVRVRGVDSRGGIEAVHVGGDITVEYDVNKSPSLWEHYNLPATMPVVLAKIDSGWQGLYKQELLGGQYPIALATHEAVGSKRYRATFTASALTGLHNDSDYVVIAQDTAPLSYAKVQLGGAIRLLSPSFVCQQFDNTQATHVITSQLGQTLTDFGETFNVTLTVSDLDTVQFSYLASNQGAVAKTTKLFEIGADQGSTRPQVRVLYSDGKIQVQSGSGSHDKLPKLHVETCDYKLLGSRCAILNSAPTNTSGDLTSLQIGTYNSSVIIDSDLTWKQFHAECEYLCKKSVDCDMAHSTRTPVAPSSGNFVGTCKLYAHNTVVNGGNTSTFVLNDALSHRACFAIRKCEFELALQSSVSSTDGQICAFVSTAPGTKTCVNRKQMLEAEFSAPTRAPTYAVSSAIYYAFNASRSEACPFGLRKVVNQSECVFAASGLRVRNNDLFSEIRSVQYNGIIYSAMDPYGCFMRTQFDSQIVAFNAYSSGIANHYSQSVAVCAHHGTHPPNALTNSPTSQPTRAPTNNILTVSAKEKLSSWFHSAQIDSATGSWSSQPDVSVSLALESKHWASEIATWREGSVALGHQCEECIEKPCFKRKEAGTHDDCRERCTSENECTAYLFRPNVQGQSACALCRGLVPVTQTSHSLYTSVGSDEVEVDDFETHVLHRPDLNNPYGIVMYETKPIQFNKCLNCTCTTNGLTPHLIVSHNTTVTSCIDSCVKSTECKAAIYAEDVDNTGYNGCAQCKEVTMSSTAQSVSRRMLSTGGEVQYHMQSKWVVGSTDSCSNFCAQTYKTECDGDLYMNYIDRDTLATITRQSKIENAEWMPVPDHIAAETVGVFCNLASGVCFYPKYNTTNGGCAAKPPTSSQQNICPCKLAESEIHTAGNQPTVVFKRQPKFSISRQRCSAMCSLVYSTSYFIHSSEYIDECACYSKLRAISLNSNDKWVKSTSGILYGVLPSGIIGTYVQSNSFLQQGSVSALKGDASSTLRIGSVLPSDRRQNYTVCSLIRVESNGRMSRLATETGDWSLGGGNSGLFEFKDTALGFSLQLSSLSSCKVKGSIINGIQTNRWEGYDTGATEINSDTACDAKCDSLPSCIANSWYPSEKSVFCTRRCLALITTPTPT